MDDLQEWSPLLLSAGALLSLLTVFGNRSKYVRVFASMLCIGLAARYLWWRYAVAFPIGQSAIQQVWASVFLVFETGSVLSAILIYFYMSRHRDRSPDADARQSSPLLRSPVDVLIATYNEDRSILERTIVGALSIDHPDLRVWVLDDGARAWVRELAEELGAHYAFRIKGKHAKAGNVNAGLARALSEGRRPEFVLLLDADFVANRNILKRTLGLFEEQDVGIVQTPQHFFNPDPVQSNLLCASVWPDEQRFFYNVLQPCKDAWGAAFCCGTSAVLRVAALEACGGMATETVTEDMLTTFKMDEVGYRTIFLNEQLSLGLAAEGLKEYITQRSRWCLGTIQQIYTRWGFAGRARISWINRLSCLDGILYWAFTFPFKLMMLTAPLVYWWTGTAVINSSVGELIFWFVPYFVCGIIYMYALAGNLVMPVMTDITQLLSSFVVCRTVATTLFKPWGHPFKVTAKGVATDRITVQWSLLLPFVALAVLTVAGMVMSMSPFSPLNGTSGYSVNIFWSIFNVAVLLLTAAVCVELPKRRQDDRFVSGETGRIELSSGESFPCTVLDLSLGGARIADLGHLYGIIDSGVIVFADGLRVPFMTVRIVGPNLAIRFSSEPQVRRSLIAKLFTGDYNNEVKKVRFHTALRQVGAAVFR